MIDVADAVVVALLAAIVAAFGHTLTRRTSKESAILQVMQSQITDLWGRVQQQEKRIDDLVADRHHERSRAWAAITYARDLLAYIAGIRSLVSETTPDPPAPPEVLDDDL